MVYKWSLFERTKRSKWVGTLGDDGTFKSGLDRTQLKTHGRVMTGQRKRSFGDAAVSDTFLTIAGSGTGLLMFFAVGEGDHSVGDRFFTIELQGVVKKLLFSDTDLVVISDVPEAETEVCRFYPVQKYPTIGRRQSNDHRVFSAHSEVQLAGRYTIQANDEQFLGHYNTRDAKFSSDGQKLVMCSNHVYGSALVSILEKERGVWKIWGRRQVVFHGLDPWDEGCLGFTGVSLSAITVY